MFAIKVSITGTEPRRNWGTVRNLTELFVEGREIVQPNDAVSNNAHAPNRPEGILCGGTAAENISGMFWYGQVMADNRHPLLTAAAQ